jgi:L-ribulokinase
MLVDHREVEVKGISGVSEDGILPGFFGYETGQPGVGDLFEWYIRCMMPSAYTMEAKKHKKSLYEWMEYKAGKIAPGQSGLVALDWINGNRSILSDMNLSGLLAGITLETKPEDIYRTFLEATSFGTRTIIENYRDAGLPVKELFACGGLSIRNNLLMQIFADVLDMEIKISETQETPALGAAMYAACAAGSESGGYDNIFEASTHMSRIKKESYLPNSAHHGIYNELFGLYKDIHNSFGREYHAGFMKDLKDIRLRAISNIQK